MKSAITDRLTRIAKVIALAALLAEPAGSATAGSECPQDWQPAFAYDTTLYPFTNRCLALAPGTLHYFDESPEGQPLGTVLMLHGNPSWSFLYRDIARDLLARGYRVVAPDYYGFGLSDKLPLDDFGYRPIDHANVMRAFVLALDLQQVTLVVQDWGGPIGIAVAGAMPERFSAFVIMNTFLQRIRPLQPGVNHLGADFSLDNILHPDEWRNSGRLPHAVGLSLGSLYGSPGSPDNIAVRNAYWGPFLDLDSGMPLDPDIIAPTNLFAQNLILSGDFQDTVNEYLRGEISSRPLFLLWGHDDRMWGALLCDADAQPMCPGSADCVIADGGRYCVSAGQGFLYPQIAVIRRAWQQDRIVGELVSPDGKHFVQEVEQEAIVAAVEAVSTAARAERRPGRQGFTAR